MEKELFLHEIETKIERACFASARALLAGRIEESNLFERLIDDLRAGLIAGKGA